MTASAPPPRRWWSLDDRTSWRTATRLNLVIARSALELQPLTGRARLLDENGHLRLPSPSALAADPRGRLLVLDSETSRITRVVEAEAGAVRSETIPDIGGIGTTPRRLLTPRGLAVLPSGGVAVADTGNHRVQVFTVAAALVHVHGAHDAFGRPHPGRGRLEFHAPCDVAADAAGALFVADRGNGRVQWITPDGRWRRDLGAGVLSAPVRVAVSTGSTVAVVDEVANHVFVFDPGRALPRTVPVADPTALAFGPGGVLYVGDQRGTLHTFAPTMRGGFVLAGSAPTGVTKPIAHILVSGVPARLTLIVEGDLDDPSVAPGNDPVAPDSLWVVDAEGGRALEGTLVTEPIDGGGERHVWTRIRVRGSVPRGATVLIESSTSDEPGATAPPTWSRCLLSGNDNPDCLVQSPPGRYLRLRLTVRSNGRVSPRLEGVDVALSGFTFLRYLPRVFQEDEESRDFLDRFLAIFQTGFDDLNARIDRLGDLADPFRADAAFLPWIAQLIGLPIDPSWPEEQLRTQLAGAVRGYRRRGTADGLVAAIKAYAGIDARIVEHFHLRQLARVGSTSTLDGTAALWSPDRIQRLQLGSYSQIGRFRLISRPEPAVEALDWGAHRFGVLFHSTPYAVDEVAARVARVVQRDKPAHTDAGLCPVFPRLRVGVQARLGVDALVGDISYTVLGRLATLNYDTVLACSTHQRALEQQGAAIRPRVGITTRLP